jgi:hypothetical protein
MYTGEWTVMKKIKSIVIKLIVLACVIGGITVYFMSQNWTHRYKAEMDQFFGEGNWEYLSKEKNESTAFNDYYPGSSSGNAISVPMEYPGKYTKWHISFNHKYGEEEAWYISDHILKINNDKHGLFSSKKLSSKQAFYMQLMDIALYVASKEIFNEFIRSELTENEANSIDITMYDQGNPKPKFYNVLAKEDWFTVNNVTAEDFLANDLQEFYILIRVHDYNLNNLTEQERQNVSDALDRVEKRLLETYGEHASFEIFFDGKRAEYVNGEKQT